MSLQLAYEIWKTLKPTIETSDTDTAAESLVSFLVDEDYSPEEIKQVFFGDADIKEALAFYLESPEDSYYRDEDEEEEEYDDDDGYEDEDY
jgi:hypothetical protein